MIDGPVSDAGFRYWKSVSENRYRFLVI